MGSGGGGTTVQKADPWSGAQPYLRRNYADAQSAISGRNAPDFYPGQTFANPTQQQLAPFQYGFDYLSNVYGTPFGPANYAGPNVPQYGNDQSLQPRLPGGQMGPSGRPIASRGRGAFREPFMDQFYLDGATPTGSPELRSRTTGLMRGTDQFGNSAADVAAHHKATAAYRAAGMPGNVHDWMQQNYPNLPQLKNAEVMTAGKATPPWGGGAPPVSRGTPGVTPSFDLMAGQANRMLGGATGLGSYARGVSPLAMANLHSAFSGPQNMINTPGQSYQPQGVNLGFSPGALNFGFQTPDLTRGIGTPQLDPGRFDPNIVRQDINPALGEMLSGEGDYGRVQEAVRAGAQPTLDILKEDILPGLRSRTVSSSNPTGEIKDLNRIVPRVMRDISNMGTQAALGEYNRAKGAQQVGANLAGTLGTQGYGLGLQGAGTQAGLEQATQGLTGDLRSRMAGLDFGATEQQAGLDRFGQGLGLQAATTQAGLNQALQNQRMGASQFDVGTGLQADIARQGALNAFRGDTLGLGNLGLGANQGLSQDISRGMAMYPGVIQQGMLPMQTLGQYGDMVQNYENAGIQEDMNRYNFYQQRPMNMQQYMSGILSGAGGLGGTTTSQGPGSNPMLGAAGGALGGAGLASMLSSAGALNSWNPWGWAMMGGGALLGAMA
jgi:hypothetical protein